jgi:hypothetical protein
MSPVANIAFLIWFAGVKWTRKVNFIPHWQTIVILIMLLLQLIAAFI